MPGRRGFENSSISFLIRPPALGRSRPLPLSSQPPFHFSWSSYPRGYPCPGRGSPLLSQMYSVRDPLAQACLQVTEQVWQPMHLSRFITIDIWAMTLMSGAPSYGRSRDGGGRVHTGWSPCQYSTGAVRLRITVTSSRWFPVGP